MVSSNSIALNLCFLSNNIVFGNGYQSLHSTIGCFIGWVVLITLVVVLFLKFYVNKRKTLRNGFSSGFNKHKRKDMEVYRFSGIKVDKLPIFSYE